MTETKTLREAAEARTNQLHRWYAERIILGGYAVFRLNEYNWVWQPETGNREGAERHHYGSLKETLDSLADELAGAAAKKDLKTFQRGIADLRAEIAVLAMGRG